MAYPLVDINQLERASTKEVVFDWNGYTIWLKLSNDIEPIPAGPHEEAVIAWLADGIDDWNLARGKKKKLEIKRRTLKRLPRALVRKMQEEIQKALNPAQQDAQQ